MNSFIRRDIRFWKYFYYHRGLLMNYLGVLKTSTKKIRRFTRIFTRVGINCVNFIISHIGHEAFGHKKMF